MNAVSRLFFGLSTFDESWRGHAATMRAATVLSFSTELAPNLAVSFNLAKGFDPNFNGATAIEDLFEELDFLKNEGYRPLRNNCLLGVCAAFESFVKTYVAALSYEPDWQTKTSDSNRLQQDTTSDFSERFSKADKRWKKSGYEKLLQEEFTWLDAQLISQVADVFWFRNQIAHNAGVSSKEKTLDGLNEVFSAGQAIVIDQVRLGKCVDVLRRCVKHIADGTPYVEAI
jgi:hypothetical protein